MNCGCGRPHDRHGEAANITIEDLERAAGANGQSLRETVDHIAATLAMAERGAAPKDDAGGLGHPAGDEPVAPAPRGTPESES